MALPDSGQLSTQDIYEERWGDGASPSGSYSLEQIQGDWNLPETPNDTDIFYGKGRVEISNGSASNITDTAATLEGIVDSSGGYSASRTNTEWRFRYRKYAVGASWSYTPIRDYTGTYEEERVTGLESDYIDYEYQFMCRNIHDNNSWTYSGSALFQTDRGAPTNVYMSDWPKPNIATYPVQDPVKVTGNDPENLRPSVHINVASEGGTTYFDGDHPEGDPKSLSNLPTGNYDVYIYLVDDMGYDRLYGPAEQTTMYVV